MTILNDKSPLEKSPPKRSFEHGEGSGSKQNFKRPKVITVKCAGKRFSIPLGIDELGKLGPNVLGSGKNFFQPRPLARKYPPLKLQKEVPASKQLENSRFSKSEGKSNVEQRRLLVETKQRNDDTVLTSPNKLESNGPKTLEFKDQLELVSRNKVTEALNLFEEIYGKMYQKQKLKPTEQRKSSLKISLESAAQLKQRKKCVNVNKKVLGSVPGVKVGDQFHFRAELPIIGLHHKFIHGIDYFKENGMILATSIVDSGRYTNNIGFSDVLIYSGQGGNPVITRKKPEDQKLEKGNLALRNSMILGTPIRVILRHASRTIMKRIEKKTYIYHGLFTVTKYWRQKGSSGKLVFMFQLHRISGQPKCSPNMVSWSRKAAVCHNESVVDDISQRKGKMNIRAMNDMDEIHKRKRVVRERDTHQISNVTIVPQLATSSFDKGRRVEGVEGFLEVPTFVSDPLAPITYLKDKAEWCHPQLAKNYLRSPTHDISNLSLHKSTQSTVIQERASVVDNKAKAFQLLELDKVTLHDHKKIAKDAKRKLTEDKKKIEEDLDVANLVLDTTYTNAEVDALKFLQMEKDSSESIATFFS